MAPYWGLSGGEQGGSGFRRVEGGIKVWVIGDQTHHMNAVELHSGDYVERFKASPMERVRRLVDLMKVGPETRVADFGCGIGMLLHCLPEYGEYAGVDFSPDFIREATKLAEGRPNAYFYCEDIESFCANHQREFDVASTLDFSEHIDDCTFVNVYSAINSSLTDGGRLYLHTPNFQFILERMKDRGILRQFPEHIAVRQATQLSKLLKQCGFTEIKIETVPHYNILKHIHPLSSLPLIGHWFAARLWIEASVRK